MNGRLYDMLDENECKVIQNRLKAQIVAENQFTPCWIKMIAGVDFAYWKKDNYEYAVCCSSLASKF